jgi:hypothetical protein
VSPPSLAGIVPLQDLGVVAVYRFTDQRGQEPRVIGQHIFLGSSSLPPLIGGKPEPIRTAEALDVVVSQAFLAGLKARGFSVVDRTGTPLNPADVSPEKEGKASGEIAHCWLESRSRSGVSASLAGTALTTHGQCRVLVRAHHRDSQVPAIEKTYRAAAASARADDVGVLTEMLADLVRQAVNDPELVKWLSGK